MTIHKINEHKVDVPDDMEVRNGQTGPGAHDYILYRGVEIVTYEQDEEQEIYQGKFAVLGSSSDLEVFNLPNLDVARATIDAYLQ